MRYNDTPAKSAEYLRQALPLMTRQHTALHPVSYAVWYEYVAGMNKVLKEQIDALAAQERLLDEDTTWHLYCRHIADINEDLARNISADIDQVLANMADSAEVAGDQASRFGDSLARLAVELAQNDTSGLATIRQEASEMQEAVNTLKQRLEQSQQEIKRLEQEVSVAREDALSDSLTGLSNRKGFDLALAQHLAKLNDESRGICLLMADIDNFKKINDTYGHVFGDKVIQTVAEILRTNIKGSDLAARFGGEEFVIILPETPLEGACALAEKIRSTIARSRIHRNGQEEALESITVSFGVSRYQPSESVNDFIVRADRALYESKHQGRNRVTVA